jgi:hypothetical protein
MSAVKSCTFRASQPSFEAIFSAMASQVPVEEPKITIVAFILCSIQKKLLVLVDTLAIAFTLTSILTLAISFALCTEVVAEHGSEDEVLFGCELIQWTSNDEPDGIQTLAPPEINIQILLSGRLQQIRNALTLQSLYSQFTVFLVTGE